MRINRPSQIWMIRREAMVTLYWIAAIITLASAGQISVDEIGDSEGQIPINDQTEDSGRGGSFGAAAKDTASAAAKDTASAAASVTYKRKNGQTIQHTKMDSGELRVRICIWYDFKLGKTAAESRRDLCSVFGEQALSERQVRNWFLRFRDGYDSLEEEDHERRPVSVNSSVLMKAIEQDPRQTTRELSAQFGTLARLFTRYLLECEVHASNLEKLAALGYCRASVARKASTLNKCRSELYKRFKTVITSFYNNVLISHHITDASASHVTEASAELIMRTLEWDDMGVNINDRQSHHLRFADDIALITPYFTQAEHMLTDFDGACGEIGLLLNLTKTMFMRNGYVSDAPFSLNGTNI
ncbi:unnamed protein product [Nippostrongylus brasiliensis]|uniref:HTH_48 domain-containing protein n=1 Tax=Nippostrongylus brasiliensis TaxID=27835 RepID=A0A0N4YFS4_NIPBR|nr:unnamed protein product [Nippostrongylus brasiliensis]